MGTVDGAQRDWGASGLAHLTGLPSGFPDFSRAGVLAAARSTAADLQRHLGIQVNAAELLAGRAALLGLSRRAGSPLAERPGSSPRVTGGVR